MPNKRSSNQTLIACALNRDLLRAMDAVCTKTGDSRSTFIRQALVAKIQGCHQPVQADWIQAQVRAPGQHRYVPPETLAKTPGQAPGGIPRRNGSADSSRQPTRRRTSRR